jgi:hypothetical protein
MQPSACFQITKEAKEGASLLLVRIIARWRRYDDGLWNDQVGGRGGLLALPELLPGFPGDRLTSINRSDFGSLFFFAHAYPLQIILN